MATYYKRSAGAGWRTTDSWASSSGGAGLGATYPVAGDTAIFDSNSIATTTLAESNACAVINLGATSGSPILNCATYTITGTSTFTGGATAKIITVNTNGLINASGSLTGFSSYTYNSGFTIEVQETCSFDGTRFPSSANVKYIINGTSKTATQSATYLMNTLTVTLGTYDFGIYALTVSGLTSVGNSGILIGGNSDPVVTTGASWSRSGQYVTVTKNSHGYLYGERINVTVSDNSSAVPVAQNYRIHNITTNTFDITPTQTTPPTSTPATRSGTTLTITSSSHGLTDGDTIIITARVISPPSVSTTENVSFITSLPISKTITYIDANTFSIQVENSGETNYIRLTFVKSITATSTTGITFSVPGAGLTTTGLTFGMGVSSADFQIGTRITNYGDITVGNAAVWKTLPSVTYTQIGNGNSSTHSSGCALASFMLPTGVTLTATSTTTLGSNQGASIVGIYGTINIGSHNFIMPGVYGLYFDSGADIQGTGNYTQYNEAYYPISDWARTTAISLTGNFTWTGNSGAFRKPLAADFSNCASLRFGQGIAPACYNHLQQSTGGGNTFKCKKLIFSQGVSTQTSLNNSNSGGIIDNTMNCNIECSEEFDLGNTSANSYYSSWYKTGSTVILTMPSLGARSSNIPLGIYASSDPTALPVDVTYNMTTTSSATLNWAYTSPDSFIVVTETATTLNTNYPIYISTTSSTPMILVNDVKVATKLTTDTFSIPITEVCTWYRITTTMYIHVPRTHGLSASNSVYIQACDKTGTAISGSQTVVAVSETMFTIACADDGTTTGELTYNAVVASGTLLYRYLSITTADTVGTGTSGTAITKGPYWMINGTSGNIKLTGTNQKIYTPGSGSPIYWERSGTAATIYHKDLLAANQYSSPHLLTAGVDYVYINTTTASGTLPVGDYLVQTTPTSSEYTVTCSDTGPTPGNNYAYSTFGMTTTSSCTRSTTTLTIPATAHGFATNDKVAITAISDSAILTAGITLLTVTRINDNSFSVPCNNAGATTGITVTWTGTVRTTTALLIHHPNHGLTTSDSIFTRTITDQRMKTVGSLTAVSATNLTTNQFEIACTNAGITSSIATKWVMGVTISRFVNFSRTTVEKYFKTDNLVIDGNSGADLIYGDMACKSLLTTSAETIQSNLSGVQRNVYATNKTPITMTSTSSCTRSSTTLTIPATSHGLLTNDNITIFEISDASILTVPISKAVTYINANSFSVTCSAAGATSGITVVWAEYVAATFKDINFGSKDRVLAKLGTNLGNNKGIVFKDKVTL